MFIRGTKRLKQSTKLPNSIKLYRSPLFKAFHFIALLIIIAITIYNICIVAEIGFKEYFFSGHWLNSSDDFLYSAIGVFSALCFFLDILFNAFLACLIVVSLFFNRIVIKNNILEFFYLPRLFHKFHINDVCKITKINDNDKLFWYQKVFSYTFNKSDLYKFECYDTTFVLSCKDSENIKILMNDINERHNKTEKEQQNYSSLELTNREKIIIGLIVVLLLCAVQNFLDLF